jgi:hypothetical protein
MPAPERRFCQFLNCRSAGPWLLKPDRHGQRQNPAVRVMRSIGKTIRPVFQNLENRSFDSDGVMGSDAIMQPR